MSESPPTQTTDRPSAVEFRTQDGKIMLLLAVVILLPWMIGVSTLAWWSFGFLAWILHA